MTATQPGRELLGRVARCDSRRLAAAANVAAAAAAAAARGHAAPAGASDAAGGDAAPAAATRARRGRRPESRRAIKASPSCAGGSRRRTSAGDVSWRRCWFRGCWRCAAAGRSGERRAAGHAAGGGRITITILVILSNSDNNNNNSIIYSGWGAAAWRLAVSRGLRRRHIR